MTMDTPRNLPSDTPKYAKPFWTILGCAIAAALVFTLVAQWPHANVTDFTPQFPAPVPLPEPAPTLNERPMGIGVILPLSGEKKEIGKALLRAAEMAIADINTAPEPSAPERAPAVTSLKLVVEDGACDEKTAHDAAKKIIAQNIYFLIGGACSEEVRGIAAAMRGSEAILLSPSATRDSVRNDAIFRLVPSAKQTDAVETLFHTQDTEPNTEKRTLVPYFNEHTAAAERFFGRYKAHYQEDPIVPWYLANMYSAFFLVEECNTPFPAITSLCKEQLFSLQHANIGALTDFSFTKQGDAVWETFVVQEKDFQGITRDVSLFEAKK